MFTLLHSSRSQELFESTLVIKVATIKKYNGAVCPSYRLRLKYPVPSAMFNLLHSSINQELFWKAPRVATMKNADDFCYAKEAITCNH